MATLSASTVARQPRQFRLNILTAAIGCVLGFFIGLRLGIAAGFAPDDNAPLFMAYAVGGFGYLLGLGFFNPAIRWGLGLPAPSTRQAAYTYGESQTISRYFRLTLDHKVIGIQYLALILAMFCFGGFSAMLIRLELITPDSTFFAPDTYLTLVGLHSGTMVFMGTSAIIGPLGNYFIPIMIGARRMAYPWLEALSLWLLLLAFVYLASTLAFGGFPTGWTGYAPLADEAHAGMDSYIVAFILVGAGLVVSSINILATVLFLRAPGMVPTRIPLLVWSIIVAAILAWLAAPVVVATQSMVFFDRTFNTGFFIAAVGGSAYLYENLFWTFGHPEVYIFAVPAFGVVLECLPVFARKPLFSYNAAVIGMFGIGLMSWFVWQHHLFMSGIDPGLRPFFMFSTEMISFPTSIVFFNMVGTLYKGRIRFTTPMLFALAFFFNFLMGGFSGVFLSDVPTDVQLHGSYAVQAHFHFVLMGATVFALFGGTYYWFPKFTGRLMNERLGKIHFWWSWIGFNGTFITLMIVGFMGMPRRVVTYLPELHTANVIASTFAFVLGASIVVFLFNLVYSWGWGKVSPANPWESRGLEWQVATPIPVDNFAEVPLIVSAPYEYGIKDAPPVAILNPSQQGLGPDPATADAMERRIDRSLTVWLARMLAAAGTTFFASYFFAFILLELYDRNNQWLPAGITHPAAILGIGNIVLLVLSGLVYFWGQIEMRRGAAAKFSGYCALALLLGLGATAFLAASLIHTPFDTQAGGYASVFFGLTRVLGTVLLASLVFMVGLCYRAIKGMYSRENMAVIDAFGEYWGWLIAMSAISYTLLYILPFLHLE